MSYLYYLHILHGSLWDTSSLRYVIYTAYMGVSVTFHVSVLNSSVLTEILKLSTVIACVSNFIYNIIASVSNFITDGNLKIIYSNSLCIKL